MAWGPESGRSVPLPPNWGVIAEGVLERDGRVCQWQGADPWHPTEGLCGGPATEVDHMGDPSDHDEANLRALCTPHHRIRTSAQGNAARWAHRRTRPRERFSWSLDD